uniref:DUF4806 domain-containing protein n=1 Tax=Anopheles coluzzii TaxID=1518534 RepID=A0A6E8VKZ6_ANOCL|nr:uncharacterized protein LOC120950751 isoform X3 [Anopheles coluzzii]
MENSQTKRSTRSAAPPAVSAEMPELKEEPIDDDISLDHTRQAATESTHQEGFVSSGARDPFLDEMEIGETSITFPNAFLDAFGQDVKTEHPTAEESDLNAEAVEAAGSSTAKRKNCDDEESEEDSSSATKRLPNSNSSIIRCKIVQTRDAKGHVKLSVVPDHRVSVPSNPKKIQLNCTDANEQTQNHKHSIYQEVDRSKQEHQRITSEDADSLITMSDESLSGFSVNNSMIVHTLQDDNSDIEDPTSKQTTTPVSRVAASNIGISESKMIRKARCSNCKTMTAMLKAQTKLLINIRSQQKRTTNEMLKNQKILMNRMAAMELRIKTLLNDENADEANKNADESIPFFDQPLVASLEGLEKLDKDLEDEGYFRNLTNELLIQIVDEDPNNRMLTVLDAIFDKTFLTTCSWTGISKKCRKIAMISYQNVLKVFQSVGSTHEDKVTKDMVQSFFMNKLKHAKERLKAKGLVRSKCRTRQTFTLYKE